MKPDIGFLLKVIQENLERHANQMFKTIGLTSSQVRVLGYLRSRGQEPTTQKDIESYLQVTHPTVVGILKRLEQKGFLHCEFDGDDRRKKYVYLTQKEARLHEEMEKSHDRMENLMTSGMSEAQIQQLRTLLLQILENVKTG